MMQMSAERKWTLLLQQKGREYLQVYFFYFYFLSLFYFYFQNLKKYIKR